MEVTYRSLLVITILGVATMGFGSAILVSPGAILSDGTAGTNDPTPTAGGTSESGTDGCPELEAATTNVQEADTDGDGIPDWLEETTEKLDPTTVDTDGDGTPDAQEDIDGDGLSVGEEVAASTIVGIEDTDEDRLTDGAEVERHCTDPLDRKSVV